MTTRVQVQYGGTGANTAAGARASLGAAPSIAYDIANAAYAQANTGSSSAAAAYGQANSAYTQANNAYGQANSAYTQANSAFTAANTAQTTAQNAYGQANLAYSAANTAQSTAQNAYGQANSAYSQANSAYGQANSAFSAANNRVLKSGDTMTGQLNISSGGLLVTGNSNFDNGTLFIDSVNDRIGIGLTNPDVKLYVYEPTLGGTAGDIKNYVTLQTTSGNADYLKFFKIRTTTGTSWITAGTRIQQQVDSTWHGYIQFNGDNSEGISFGTGGSTVGPLSVTERMRINNSGDVGIGTSSPTNKFEVRGDDVRGVVQSSTNSSVATIETQAYNYWSGTGGPTYTGTALVQYGAAASGTTLGISNANLGALRFQNGSVGAIYTNGGQPIVFGTSGTERMRITSSGALLAGTTTLPTYVQNVFVGPTQIQDVTTGGGEYSDWPIASFSIRSYDDYTENTMLGFLLRDDSAYLSSSAGVWNFRISAAAGQVTSNSTTTLRLSGPGPLFLNSYGNDRLQLYSDNTTEPSSFRAPIFYDSDNTGYYVNPASTSNLNVLAVGRAYAGYDSGQGNSFSCSNWFRSNGSSGWYNDTYGGGIYMVDTTWIRTYNSKSFYVGGGYIETSGSVRGPIFYDSNDTNYYIDPASSSYLNSGTMIGRWTAYGSQSSGSLLTSTSNLGGLELQGGSNAVTANAALMCFHRPGAYASYFGIDTDNQFAVGGWSAGAALANFKCGSLGVGGAASGTAGVISGSGKVAIETADTYLRINQNSTFTAGIWYGSSNRLGGAGYIAAGSNGSTTTSRVWIYGGTFDGTNVISLDGSNGNIYGAGKVTSRNTLGTINSGGSKTLAVGEMYTVTSATQTITLPASPSAGDTVGISVGNFTDTTIARNSQNIMGLAENMTVDTAYAGFTLRFSDATYGWRIV